MDHILSFTGMLFIVPLALFVYYSGKHLHKNEHTYYIVSAIIALVATVLAVLAQIGTLGFSLENIPVLYQLIFQGHLTFAFFVLVMFAGGFKKKSKPKIALMRVRREMAILGFIFLIPHATFLIITALSALNPTGTIAFLVMIPLFVTSFTSIRKKMHPLQWRKLHKWAYLVYLMIYVHLLSINLIAQEDELRFVRAAIYTAIFGFYTYLKMKNYILPPKKESPKSSVK